MTRPGQVLSSVDLRLLLLVLRTRTWVVNGNIRLRIDPGFVVEISSPSWKQHTANKRTNLWPNETRRLYSHIYSTRVRWRSDSQFGQTSLQFASQLSAVQFDQRHTRAHGKCSFQTIILTFHSFSSTGRGGGCSLLSCLVWNIRHTAAEHFLSGPTERCSVRAVLFSYNLLARW